MSSQVETGKPSDQQQQTLIRCQIQTGLCWVAVWLAPLSRQICTHNETQSPVLGRARLMAIVEELTSVIQHESMEIWNTTSTELIETVELVGLSSAPW